MYADAGSMFSYFQNFSQDVEQLEEFSRLHCPDAFTLPTISEYVLGEGDLIKAPEPFIEELVTGLDPTAAAISMISCGGIDKNNLVQQLPTISEYVLGEGDLFKAPEPFIEEPVMGLDPTAAAISMISCGGNVTSSQAMEVLDIESIQSEQLLNEVLYECEKDLLAKSAIEELFAQIPDITIPAVHMEVDSISDKDGIIIESLIHKSVNCGCLTSMEWMPGGGMGANFINNLTIPNDMQMDTVMETCSNSLFERTVTIGNCTIEERREKLSRFLKKKTKRNFGKKIKYASRKALADSQPRVRGRFARKG